MLLYFVLNLTMIGNWLLLIKILFMTCAAGSALGIFLSTVFDDLNFIGIIALTFAEAIQALSGALWPLEGQPLILKYFSYIMPLTLPSISIRDVMIRGFDMKNPSVINGLLLLSAWIIATLSAAFYNLKKRKMF